MVEGMVFPRVKAKAVFQLIGVELTARSSGSVVELEVYTPQTDTRDVYRYNADGSLVHAVYKSGETLFTTNVELTPIEAREVNSEVERLLKNVEEAQRIQDEKERNSEVFHYLIMLARVFTKIIVDEIEEKYRKEY